MSAWRYRRPVAIETAWRSLLSLRDPAALTGRPDSMKERSSWILAGYGVSRCEDRQPILSHGTQEDHVMLYTGIDQHSKQITVSVRNEAGDVILRRQVSTRWAKMDAFVEEMKQHLTAHGGVLAVVEVCGFNH